MIHAPCEGAIRGPVFRRAVEDDVTAGEIEKRPVVGDPRVQGARDMPAEVGAGCDEAVLKCATMGRGQPHAETRFVTADGKRDEPDGVEEGRSRRRRRRTRENHAPSAGGATAFRRRQHDATEPIVVPGMWIGALSDGVRLVDDGGWNGRSPLVGALAVPGLGDAGDGLSCGREPAVDQGCPQASGRFPIEQQGMQQWVE